MSGMVALVLVAAITGVFLLEHNQKFRAYLLQRVRRNVEESTGARLAVRDFKVRLGGLHLDLFEITVHGTETASQRPLLTADHVGVDIRIDSILRGKWHLQDLTVDHPVSSISVNKPGAANLPSHKPPSTSHTSVFDLAIDSVALHQGEIYYNDKKNLLDVALRDLQLAASFDRGQNRYYGDLGYSDGHFQYGSYAPVAHNLKVKFELTAQNFKLESATLETGKSGGTLDGRLTVHDLSGKQQGRFQAIVKGVSVDQLQALSHSEPLQRNRLSGRIDADAQASWAKNLENLIAHANATIAATLGQNPAAPVNGAVHADYTRPTQEVALHQSYIRTPQTSINLDGKVSTSSQLQVRMKSSNLH